MDARAQERPSRWRRAARFRRDLGGLGLLVAIAVAAALLLFPRGDDGLIGLPELEPGDIAPRTVRSARAFSVIDPELTAQMRERARQAVRPVFDHLLGLAEGPKQRLEAAFEHASAEERRRALAEALPSDVPDAALAGLAEARDPSAVLDAASMLLDELFARPMVSAPGRLASHARITVRSVDAEGRVTREREMRVDSLEALGPNQARARVDALAARRLGHLPERARGSVVRAVKSSLTPNLVANAQETLRRRRLAWISVKPSQVMVHRGERVLRAGERVTARDLLLVRELARLESPQARFRSSVGAAILGALFAWLGLRVARHGYRHRHPKQRDHVFLASALVGFLLFVWMGYKTVDWLAEVEPLGPMGADVYRLLLPVAGVVIVVRLAAGVLVAAAAAPVCALFAGYMMDGDLTFAAYTLAGGLAAAAVEGGAKRMVLSAGLRAGVAQALVAVGASLLDADLELQEAGVRVAGALGSGLLAALLARATLPAVEALFGYTTPTGLAALADAEHPLLRELLVESPGTYHHSLHVGALAEAGAAAIGSDRLLARVGGYFHDVGRLRRAHGEAGPSSEWARGGRLRRSASLAGPGLDGAARVPSPPERRAAAGELASGHRFPPELAQILAEQPHESARDLQPGRPKPRSKASALVFLADWVEDALRGREGSVEDADALEALVREEVRAAVAGRFLDAADLELRELAAVTEAFAAVLGPRFRSSPTDEGAFRVAPPPPGAPS